MFFIFWISDFYQKIKNINDIGDAHQKLSLPTLYNFISIILVPTFLLEGLIILSYHSLLDRQIGALGPFDVVILWMRQHIIESNAYLIGLYKEYFPIPLKAGLLVKTQIGLTTIKNYSDLYLIHINNALMLICGFFVGISFVTNKRYSSYLNKKDLLLERLGEKEPSATHSIFIILCAIFIVCALYPYVLNRDVFDPKVFLLSTVICMFLIWIPNAYHSLFIKEPNDQVELCQ